MDFSTSHPHCSTKVMEMILTDTIDESGEKIHANLPVQIVRVPVKHANLGIRSHAM